MKAKKAFISFRIGVPTWLSDENFLNLMKLFEKYCGITDEITFFTSETHPPLDLNLIRQRAPILRERIKYARAKGYSSGINILSTIGHHNENLAGSLSGDYTFMTDINGDVCRGSFCPNDENMKAYIKSLYEVIVSAEPDYIWIDDDIRLLGHMPIRCGCFCDKCLEIFGKESGYRCTRESLKDSFNEDAGEDKLKIRKTWLQHNRNTISGLFELIEKSVHDVKPGMPLGFMTGERYYEGYDFLKWAEVLSGPLRAEVRWRPGGGFYTDEKMSELVHKSHEIGRQVSLLPDHVLSIQSEIENFPYQVLKKSIRATSLEAASHIAAGCTGVAFNILGEPIAEYEPMVSNISKLRPFYDLLVHTFQRCKHSGIYTGWVKDSFAVNNLGNGDWLSGDMNGFTANHADEIFEIGLPVSYSYEGAMVSSLSGDSVLAMDREQIMSMLSSGIYMDTGALIRLNELGYRELTGFDITGSIPNDCIEEFTDHEINQGIAGWKRDGRQSFYHQPAGVLVPLAGDVQVLGRMVNYMGEETAACCLGIYENKLGGRICVSGYFPWMYLQSSSKALQMKKIMRWLSKDNLPAYVSSFHKINLWVRELENGEMGLALVNSSQDISAGPAVLIHTAKDEIHVYNMQLLKTTVTACEEDGNYKKFIIPDMGAWDMCLITV